MTDKETEPAITSRRRSGILMHISSLPSPFGIGDLGPGAVAFVDFLVHTKQSIWQVLPLTPSDAVFGNSPYSGISAFAWNKYLISPDLLVEEGLLRKNDLDPIPAFPEGRCDFSSLVPYKNRLLDLAWQNFRDSGTNRDAFEAFCSKNSAWLDDFSLFVIIKTFVAQETWNQWPEGLKNREPQRLKEIRETYGDQLEKEKFCQYLFFEQWHRLKSLSSEKGILMFGDLAIYVNFDSSDVWANPALFKLDEEKKPVFVSGVPPDYFSKTGQLWGNPVYQWDVLKETGYQWWIDRIAHHLELFDILRIDHFRGLVACWEIPAEEETAVNGRWVEAPVLDFFTCLKKHFQNLPIVAEDLGVITPDVREAMRCFGLPGMKILLFAFGEDNPENLYLPHNYERGFIVYTGTHDNNTVRGWFESEASISDKERFFRYVGRKIRVRDVHWEFIRLAMMSVADMVIIPMQDILGLGKAARMNRPSIAEGNWEWRLLSDQITQPAEERLLEMTVTYGRG